MKNKISKNLFFKNSKIWIEKVDLNANIFPLIGLLN
jgi:hypothetical protein